MTEQAEVDQARRAMAESLRIGDVVEMVSTKTRPIAVRIANETDLRTARDHVERGWWKKLQTKGGE